MLVYCHHRRHRHARWLLPPLHQAVYPIKIHTSEIKGGGIQHITNQHIHKSIRTSQRRRVQHHKLEGLGRIHTSQIQYITRKGEGFMHHKGEGCRHSWDWEGIHLVMDQHACWYGISLHPPSPSSGAPSSPHPPSPLFTFQLPIFTVAGSTFFLLAAAGSGSTSIGHQHTRFGRGRGGHREGGKRGRGQQRGRSGWGRSGRRDGGAPRP